MSEHETIAAEDVEPEDAVSDSEPENAPDEESPEETPAGPHEPNGGDSEPAEAAPQTERELEEQRGKLARSAATWRRRVNEVLGETALHLQSCPLCEPDIPGFMFPPELVTPYDEVQARLLEVLKEPDQPFLNDATDADRCANCLGYGKVRTGSKVPGQETKACSVCRGFGYTPPPGVDTNGSAGGQVERVAAFASGDAPLTEDADVWGSPRILPDGQMNPNYGKMPQYKDATLP